ncbi:hypothetical protein [Chryseolinea lacunae]|uniref:Beta-lactamase-inhibitor-like PepSY-like domain-containing protein n=1 Tax=Chryseolinea lacunae TaxID=2801331 RepID=A0ABS1KTM8_9BACT|nr:hypothetical protein [Chryseolinea lacunae]MBL0742715.1 hypothetical protein [Chryseolinea lacunae]
MRNFIVTLAFAIAVSPNAEAQISQIKIKAREAEIPADIVQSFRKDYRDTKTSEWAIMPAALVGDEYGVTGYDTSNGSLPTVYEVSFHGNPKGKAVYDQNGILKYSKETISNTSLPAATRNAVAKKYPDFVLIKDQETIRQGKSQIIHYRIVIEKAVERRVLAVDAAGKILRENKPVLKSK